MILSRRRLGYAVGALLLVLLLIRAFRASPVPVYLATVEQGRLLVTVDEEGETRIRQRFVIAAPTVGRLERLTLEEGDSVTRGEVIARIHPAPLDRRAQAQARARLEAAEALKREAEAQIHKARAALAHARRSHERAVKLDAAGTISKEQLELAQLEKTEREEELEAATFAGRSADFDAQAARAALMNGALGVPPGDALATGCAGGEAHCIELRSPVDGRVLRVHQESERVIQLGAQLLEIGDPAALEIVVDLLSTEAVKVKPGARVLIEKWGGESLLEGKVRLVEPSGFTKVSALGVEEQRVNVIVDFVNPPSSLGDGYRLEARLVIWEGEDVLTVPVSALFRRGESWSVFVAEGGRAKLREVRLGHRGSREVEVVEGLEVGERVIAHPSDQVDEGVRIKPL